MGGGVLKYTGSACGTVSCIFPELLKSHMLHFTKQVPFDIFLWNCKEITGSTSDDVIEILIKLSEINSQKMRNFKTAS